MSSRPQFDALAYFTTELTQHFVPIALLNDTLDAAIKPVAVIIRQVLGGNDHYRDVLPVGPFAKFVEELKPIHLRHHQIENDDVGPRGGKRFDCDLAVLRFRYFPPDRLKRLTYSAANDLVIVDQEGTPAVEPQMLVIVSTSLARSTGFTR